jgi:proteasome lid subunit RPN8/RPN11
MFPILPAGSPEVADTRLPAFVVAHDGLYLRKQSLLGLSQTKVDGVEHLQAEKEFVEYALPKVPADLMARVVGFFRSVYRERRTEALVLLLWRADGFDLFVPEQQVSMASVKHRLDESALADDLRVIGSIHSHGAFGAGASSIDADDEASFDGLHVVVGDFDRRRQTYSAAIAVDGQRFDVRPNAVLERPRRLIEPPDDWLRRVKLLQQTRRSKGQGKSTGSNDATASVPATIGSRASHVDLDVALVRAAGLADQLGYRLSYWLTPFSGASPKGGAVDD